MINMEKPHTWVSKCFNPAHLAEFFCTKARWEGTPSWKKLWRMLSFFLTFKFKTKEKKNTQKNSLLPLLKIYLKFIFSFLSLKPCYFLTFPVNDWPKQFDSVLYRIISSSFLPFPFIIVRMDHSVGGVVWCPADSSCIVSCLWLTGNGLTNPANSLLCSIINF